MMKMRTAVIPAVAIALIACGGGGSNYSSPTSTYGPGTTGTPVAANTVQATDGLAFDPANITVSKGTTVTFTFASITHNVQFAAGSGVSDIPNSSSTSAQRTFTTAGSFAFRCSIHAGMTGQITVQ